MHRVCRFRPATPAMPTCFPILSLFDLAEARRAIPSSGICAIYRMAELAQRRFRRHGGKSRRIASTRKAGGIEDDAEKTICTLIRLVIDGRAGRSCKNAQSMPVDLSPISVPPAMRVLPVLAFACPDGVQGGARSGVWASVGATIRIKRLGLRTLDAAHTGPERICVSGAWRWLGGLGTALATRRGDILARTGFARCWYGGGYGVSRSPCTSGCQYVVGVLSSRLLGSLRQTGVVKRRVGGAQWPG